MVMFAEKVLRRLGGNYTFVVVTDRTELDDQIAGQFKSAGALTKDIQNAQAGSRITCGSCWRAMSAMSSR
jgi:type I restriction enzyme R subunit